MIGLICSIFLITFATILFIPITFTSENYSLNIKPFSWVGNVNDTREFIVEKIPNIMLFILLGIIGYGIFKIISNLFKQKDW